MLKKRLDYKALKHGKLQVKKMLQDRPVMKKHLTEDDFIWKWVVRKFAGEDLPDTIDWDNRVPYHGARAAHLTPCASKRGCISIRKGLSFEVSWAGVIFEMFNIALYPEFKRIIHMAYAGKMKKKEFILAMARCEFKAVKRVEKYYLDIWKPWAEKKDLVNDFYEWNVGCPARFEEWIKCFGKKSDYPWKIYSDFYDDHLEEWALA